MFDATMSRAGIERLFRTTPGGTQAIIGDEVTWGHFDVTPQLVTDDGVAVQADGPSFSCPQVVPGLEIDAVIEVEVDGDFREFRIVERMPGSAPGETTLILAEP